MRTLTSRIILVAMIFLLPSIAVSDSSTKWPSIYPIAPGEVIFHFSYPFESRRGTTVRTVDEKVSYLLECSLGPYGSLEYNYSLDFECRLSTQQPDKITYKYNNEFPAIPYDNLLSTGPHSKGEWNNRGNFSWGELQPTCARYPEYGRIRHFKLRGIDLTLEIKDVKFGPRLKNDPLLTYRKNTITELTLEVTARQDLSALSPTAEPTKYLAPPLMYPQARPYDDSRNCDTVLTRGE